MLLSTSAIAQNLPTFYTPSKREIGFYSEAYQKEYSNGATYYDFTRLDFGNVKFNTKAADHLEKIFKKYNERSSELGKTIKEIFAKAKADGSLPYLENAISQSIDAPGLLSVLCQTMGANLSWNTILNLSRHKEITAELKKIIASKAEIENGIPQNYKEWTASNNPKLFEGTSVNIARAVRPF